MSTNAAAGPQPGTYRALVLATQRPRAGASEVKLEDPGRVGPEQCAASVCRLLANPPDASAEEFTVRRVPEA
ncbi:MAG: hypothetical protein M3N09_04865 [Actinomycetota bacterium]|nr:hypothetical protein [Actinomycetota bacterium]